MKNVFAFVIAIGLVALGAGFLIITTQERAEEAEMRLELERARLDTARQVALLVHAQDDKVAYDRGEAVRKHADAIEAIRKKFPGKLKSDDFIEEMESKAKAGEKDKAKTAEYRLRYDYAKQLYADYLKSGSYKTVLTGTSGGIRYDVVSIKRAAEGGTEGLRWDVFIWGLPPKDQLNLTNIELVNVIHFPDKLETSGKRKGQPKRTATKVNLAPANPYVLLDKPWDWMPEWPMGVMAGYYVNIPMFDSRTDRVNIVLNGTIRTIGGTMVPIEIKWKGVKVDGAWKGSPGGKWDDAAIEPLNDEDLKEQGVDPAEIDEAPPADDKKDGKDGKGG